MGNRDVGVQDGLKRLAAERCRHRQPDAPAREMPANDGDRRLGQLVRDGMDHRRVHALALQRSQGAGGGRREGEHASRAQPVEQRLGHAQRGVAARHDHPGRTGAGKQAQLAGLEHSVRLCPARASDAVIGELRSDHLLADATDAQCDAIAQTTTERCYDAGWARRVELLDGRRECLGERQRGVHRRHVATRLDGGDQLATDTRAGRQLGLREPALQATPPQ